MDIVSRMALTVVKFSVGKVEFPERNLGFLDADQSTTRAVGSTMQQSTNNVSGKADAFQNHSGRRGR
jgi:hypothetical protein